METAQQLIAKCVDKIKSVSTMFDYKNITLRIEELDNKTLDQNIWNDPRKAGVLMKERQKLSDIISKYSSFYEQTAYYEELAREIPEELDSQLSEIFLLYHKLAEFEFQQMMKDPADNNAAILTINAGAGGLEAANWTTMMTRMYLRWADSYKYEVERLDFNPSEEHGAICTDSISLRISGPYAYGFLKGEAGVHRLIRNSPFNSGDARHTSFAAVQVLPDIEDTIDIKIDEKDILVTAQTSTGAGGQNINRIKSAIRLRHLPTGINILVRTERDQLSNKKTAFKMLKAKLYEIEKKKRRSEQDKLIDTQMENKFGSQIRTYTLSPYSLTKDHRTGFEINNSDQVLDGDIHGFMDSYLRMK